jgi:HEAT repeat-containing taxis protein
MIVRSAAGVLLAGLAVVACRHDAERSGDTAPYVVRVDVSDKIHALGEETITADDAVEQLEQLGPAVIPALAAALTREPRDVRQRAVEVLAALGTEAAVPPLLAAAADADEDVRADALRGLGAIGDPRGRAPIEAALADPRLTVRVGGIMGCAGLCTDHESIERLADMAIHEKDPAVALAAQETLARIRAKGPVEDQAVRSALDRRRPAALPSSASADERALAAIFAADLDSADGIPALVATLESASPPLQRQVAWRLGGAGDERAVGALAPLLDATDPMVRAYAYDALVKLRDRGIDGAGGAAARYAGPKPLGLLSRPES